ncbi:MAG: CRTAC1 family protein [Acidobacteriota bacterium]
MFQKRHYWLVGVLALLAGPFSSTAEEPQSSVRFVDVLQDSGIRFQHHFFRSEQGENYRMNQYDHGSGVLVADVNGDGLFDIYLLDFLGPNALYLNKGGFKFEDIAGKAGVDLPQDVSVGGSFGDYDNDGDPDLYVTTYYTGNHLFRNRGDGTFEDVSEKAGVAHTGHSSAAVWFDYDLDGDLDLYVTNIGAFTTAETSPDAPYARKGINLPLNFIVGNPEADHGGEADILYRNNGDGTFTDVTAASGIVSKEWNGDVTVGDYDLDGYPDLYTSNMFGENNLFHNNGDGTFSNVTRKVLGRTSWGAMGALFFDATNDGYPELYVVDMHSDMWTHHDPTGVVDPAVKYDTPRGKTARNWKLVKKPEETQARNVLFGNTYFVNQRGERFEERSESAGLENFWPWGTTAEDFDSDGWVDVFVAGGMGYPFTYWPNLLMMNTGKGLRFSDRAEAAGMEPPARGKYIEGLVIKGQACSRSSRSAAAADFDGDGDMDLITNNFNHEPYLYRNDSPRRHYLQVRLRGKTANRDGFGARVKVVSGDLVQFREAHSSGGYLTQSSPVLHFGLGQQIRVDRVEVTWPGQKKVQVKLNPRIDTLLTIEQE